MAPVPAMPRGEFIERHHDEIISEFTAFARTLIPPGSDMTETDLRDHAKDMLTGHRAGSKHQAARRGAI